jgi:hypothetical protein
VRDVDRKLSRAGGTIPDPEADLKLVLGIRGMIQAQLKGRDKQEALLKVEETKANTPVRNGKLSHLRGVTVQVVSYV